MNDQDPSSFLSAKKPYGVLEVGAHKLGIDIDYLAEVCVVHDVLPLVSSRRDVLGAIDLRGSMIPLLDPQMFCNAGAMEQQPKLAAIVRSEGRQIALGFDRALGISEFENASIQDLYEGDRHPNLPVHSGLLTPDDSINLFDPSHVFAMPDLPSSAVPSRTRRDTRSKGAKAILTFEAGGAVFGLDAVRIFGTVPRQEIEQNALTGGACLGAITYLNRRVPVLDATEVLGLGDALKDSRPEIVVVRFPDDHVLGLGVDSIQRIRMAKLEDLQDVPDLFSDEDKLFSAALIDEDGQQTFTIDADVLTAREDLLRMSTFSDSAKQSAKTSRKSAKSKDGGEGVRRTRKRCLVFSAGMQVCAAISDVVSILAAPGHVTPVHSGNPTVLGLFCYEKATLPLVDMSCVLNQPGMADETKSRILIVGPKARRVGFLVHSLDGIETTEYLTQAEGLNSVSPTSAKLKSQEINGVLPFLDLDKMAAQMSIALS